MIWITIGHEPGSHEALEGSAPQDFHLENEKGARRNLRANSQPNMNVYFESVIVPPDRAIAITVGNGDLGTSPSFGLLWRRKPQLACKSARIVGSLVGQP